MKTRRIAFSMMFAGLGFAALHCGGGVASGPTNETCFGCDLGDGGGPPPGVPEMHRPTAEACPMVRPPVTVDAGPNARDAGFPGSCEVDADCTQGKNGRCGYSGGGGLRPGPTCSYDECFVDGDCGANQLCDCAANGGGNTCIASNCRVDGDCGAGAYCSPTYDEACGTFNGYVGYYCRTPRDSCVTDADCGEKKNGLCVWSKEVSKWACSYNQCVG